MLMLKYYTSKDVISDVLQVKMTKFAVISKKLSCKFTIYSHI